jgi:U3 small nucleolar RNA-associated protein 11
MARKNHKERGQLDSRKRLGLLEKHKDYVHRARDYSSKQARIKKLREKAAFRNKDEFYWGMVKGKTQNGVALGDRGNVALSSETVKLLKTQDVRYVRHQISKDQRVSWSRGTKSGKPAHGRNVQRLNENWNRPSRRQHQDNGTRD